MSVVSLDIGPTVMYCWQNSGHQVAHLKLLHMHTRSDSCFRPVHDFGQHRTDFCAEHFVSCLCHTFLVPDCPTLPVQGSHFSLHKLCCIFALQLNYGVCLRTT